MFQVILYLIPAVLIYKSVLFPKVCLFHFHFSSQSLYLSVSTNGEQSVVIGCCFGLSYNSLYYNNNYYWINIHLILNALHLYTYIKWECPRHTDRLLFACPILTKIQSQYEFQLICTILYLFTTLGNNKYFICKHPWHFGDEKST